MQLFKLILYRPPVQGLMDWRRGASTLSGNYKAHSRLRFVLGFDLRRIDPRRTECLDSLATSALSTFFIRSAFTIPLLQALRAVMRKLVTSCKPPAVPAVQTKATLASYVHTLQSCSHHRNDTEGNCRQPCNHNRGPDMPDMPEWAKARLLYQTGEN